MKWLNYHHLLYFWTVAREGSIARACDRLHLAQPTISSQIRALERSLGARLFDKSGRNLALTDAGRLAFRYADEIFSLGRELTGAFAGRPTGQAVRLVIGVTDALPKSIIHRLIEPALRLPEQVRIACYEGKPEQLLAQLAVHELDIVLSDVPANPMIRIKAFHHLLGESNISFFGTPALARRYGKGFPRSLQDAPVLLPAESTGLRRSLDQWFDSEGLRPLVRGEFADSALLNVFGELGLGLFPAPSVVGKEISRERRVREIGQVAGIRERYFAISVEKRLKHPAVVAISERARQELFAGTPAVLGSQ